jgi:hypothetical protein
MDSFWSQAISAGLGSGFAIALIKVGFDAYKLRDDGRRREDNRRHLALRLAVYLEGYAVLCASNAADHQLANITGGHPGTELKEVPVPGALPESTAYELLDPDMLDAVLDFPQRRHMASISALSNWDVTGDEDRFADDLEATTIEMGTLALEIAGRLRAKYALPPRKLSFREWNIATYFAEEAKRLAEVEKKRKAKPENDTADVLGRRSRDTR